VGGVDEVDELGLAPFAVHKYAEGLVGKDKLEHAFTAIMGVTVAPKQRLGIGEIDTVGGFFTVTV
jgi:hypothetical protein